MPEPSQDQTRFNLKSWLIARADNHRNNMELLITGAGIFFLGVGLIVWANQSLATSVEQELIALGGLLCMAGGGLTALFGYLGLSLLRLFKFFNDDP